MTTWTFRNGKRIEFSGGPEEYTSAAPPPVEGFVPESYPDFRWCVAYVAGDRICWELKCSGEYLGQLTQGGFTGLWSAYTSTGEHEDNVTLNDAATWLLAMAMDQLAIGSAESSAWYRRMLNQRDDIAVARRGEFPW